MSNYENLQQYVIVDGSKENSYSAFTINNNVLEREDFFSLSLFRCTIKNTKRSLNQPSHHFLYRYSTAWLYNISYILIFNISGAQRSMTSYFASH